jgi:hypothetical protein
MAYNSGGRSSARGHCLTMASERSGPSACRVPLDPLAQRRSHWLRCVVSLHAFQCSLGHNLLTAASTISHVTTHARAHTDKDWVWNSSRLRRKTKRKFNPLKPIGYYVHQHIYWIKTPLSTCRVNPHGTNWILIRGSSEARGYRWATLFLGDINTGTRLGES